MACLYQGLESSILNNGKWMYAFCYPAYNLGSANTKPEISSGDGMGVKNLPSLSLGMLPVGVGNLPLSCPFKNCGY
jgi:hypothetical protein